jgi:hypothetical protein
MDGFKKLPKMQCFKEGGSVKAKPAAKCSGGKMKEGGKADLAQDKALIKKAFKQHDKAEHDKEPTEIKLRKGGRTKKAVGTVKKFKCGGGVYGAKKTDTDIKSIDAAKDCKPGKAKTKSGAKETPNKYKKGGKVKKCAEGGQPGATEAQQEFYDKNKAKAVKKEKAADYEAFGSRGDAAKKGMEEGRMDALGNAFKKGGKAKKVKKYADGGTVMSDEEKAWLGGADATDPFIQARMRAALGPKKPQGSYIPNADPTMDNRDVGTTGPNPAMIEDESNRGIVTPAQQAFNKSIPGSGVNTPAPVAAAPSAPVSRAAPLVAGPSADDRLRAKYGRPIQAPNVEQDSGVAYPQGNPAPNMYANRQPSMMQRFFNATPAEQAAQFNKGVEARKKFGRTTPSATPAFSSLLDALNKPKV